VGYSVEEVHRSIEGIDDPHPGRAERLSAAFLGENGISGTNRFDSGDDDGF
jgi:hypothetical protein